MAMNGDADGLVYVQLLHLFLLFYVDNFSHDFFSAGTRIRKVHICSGIYSSNVQTWKRVELDAADGTPWCCPSPCFKASTHVDVDAELQEVAGAEDGHRRGRPLPPQANSVKETEVKTKKIQWSNLVPLN